MVSSLGNTALLVVDVQKEFVKGVYTLGIFRQISQYVESHNYSTVIGTVFKNTVKSNFVKMLDWHKCMHSSKPAVACDKVFEKQGYGLSADNIEQLRKYSRVDIVGIDTDACVMAVAFQLFDAGLNFRILTRYCYSVGGRVLHKAAVTLMRRNFGKAVVI